MQVNARQRDALYQRAVEYAAPATGDRVIDAYAGIGMLSARLAAGGAEVICLEESPYAVRLGELNMQLNGCSRVRYRRGRVEDTVGQVEQPVDVLVLDPPRAGCLEAAVEAMAAAAPARIIYVSCEPSTLARDMERLCAGGRYTLSDVTLVDMFPQTYHMETVARLERTA